MQILIKQIREHLNISQTELAEQLNVTFATVNRWENGRAVPNKLAQTKLYDICKENDVPVYDITLNRIADADLSGESETLQEQRDIFVFQCQTGCRVSDLLRLTPGNVQNGIL